MKILGIIAEYNPFHLGHKYHIEESKKRSSADATIVVMSGSFVQRGEPAALDKWSRAKMAINNGVDLVIELPFIYSSQTAEIFAEGGIRLLKELNIIDYISFGSELGDLDTLSTISKTLVDEPYEYKKHLKTYLNQGIAFPISRSKALDKTLNINNIENIVSSPNNILAIEYLKAIYKYNFNVRPLTINRKGNNYKDENLSQVFSSATSIRNQLLNNNLSPIKSSVDKSSYSIINDFLERNNFINNMKRYEYIYLYLLRIAFEDSLDFIIGADHGLGNKILNNAKKYNKIEDIISNSISKSHTRTRVQRVLIHLLHGLSKSSFNRMNKNYPNYIRILATNKKGFELINLISEKSNLPIINKFSEYQKYKDPNLQEIIEFDKKSTDLFYLPFNNSPVNKDFFISPYIKK